MRIPEGSTRRGAAGPRLTAMIDVVFLLIIFFMVVTELSKMEAERLSLPVATRGVDERPGRRRVIVNIMHSGTIVVQRRTYYPAELGRLLREIGERDRDADGFSRLAVKIRADAKVQYRYVQHVMVQCMRHGIWKLSFGCAPSREAAELRPRA